MKWTEYKNIRKLYKDEDPDNDYYQFTYYNWTYCGSSVALVKLLMEEIHADFPEVSEENIHVGRAPDFPYELLLQFLVEKDKVSSQDLLKFEKMPEDLRQL